MKNRSDSVSEKVFNRDGKFDVYSTSFRYFKPAIPVITLLWILIAFLISEHTLHIAYLGAVVCVSLVMVPKKINKEYAFASQFDNASDQEKLVLKYKSVLCAFAAGIGLASLPIGLIHYIFTRFI